MLDNNNSNIYFASDAWSISREDSNNTITQKC